MSRKKRYVAVIGSQSATREDVLNAIQSVGLTPQHHAIVSGGARGADAHAKEIAITWGFEYVEVPAFWNERGKGAGMQRNSTIIDLSDAVIAVWDGHSADTKDSIDKANASGTKIEVFVAMHGIEEVNDKAAEAASNELDEAQQAAMENND